jgi:hypothetical protein
VASRDASADPGRDKRRTDYVGEDRHHARTDPSRRARVRTVGEKASLGTSQASAYPSFVTLSKQARNRQFIPGGHGRRGRAPAGHSLRAAVAPQPSTTHAPPGALWQPGPHPSAALAAPKIEKLPANRTATKRFLNVTSMVGAASPLGQAYRSSQGQSTIFSAGAVDSTGA